MFYPGLAIGQNLKNSDIVELFKCGNMGGMRRSRKTGTLVLITDYTKGIYHDKWIGGVLHYTAMGKHGDQDINWSQNATLANYGHNDVDMHLFEVLEEGVYTYCGRIELVEKPYQDTQPDEDGLNRKVWIFPIRPIPDNDVKKPAIFVFSDMADYRARGKSADALYVKMAADAKKSGRKKFLEYTPFVFVPLKDEKEEVIPQALDYLVGEKIEHRILGKGVVVEVSGQNITVNFDSGLCKKYDYNVSINKKIIEVVHH